MIARDADWRHGLSCAFTSGWAVGVYNVTIYSTINLFRQNFLKMFFMFV